MCGLGGELAFGRAPDLEALARIQPRWPRAGPTAPANGTGPTSRSCIGG